jgi:hypothetical protein
MALLDLVLGTLQVLDVALLAGPAALETFGNLLGRLDAGPPAEGAPVLPEHAATAGVGLPWEPPSTSVVHMVIASYEFDGSIDVARRIGRMAGLAGALVRGQEGLVIRKLRSLPSN